MTEALMCSRCSLCIVDAFNQVTFLRVDDGIIINKTLEQMRKRDEPKVAKPKQRGTKRQFNQQNTAEQADNNVDEDAADDTNSDEKAINGVSTDVDTKTNV